MPDRGERERVKPSANQNGGVVGVEIVDAPEFDQPRTFP